jgi:hypothetical protein
VDTVFTFSDVLWVRVTVVVFDVEAERRCAAGFASCAWLSGVALSVFERVVVRLRVLVGFICSFASGVSDVLLMKKTPFYLTIRQFGDRNLSSQP